jgi:2-polyprenyl-3-methyl-5-hydroxy-6-metoxy-1,4-benzoquinol methylase
MGMHIQHPDGIVDIAPLGDGKVKVTVHSSNPDLFIPISSCETSYSLELIEQILAATGFSYLCDEIMRDESPAYVEELIRQGLFPFVDEQSFAGKTILDFGSGSGASTMALCRLVPQARIVGIELEEKYARVAHMRQQHYGVTNAKFLLSPSADRIPSDIGTVDYVVMSSVYEHLLPHERKNILLQLWRVLQTGGVLFLHGTPHRYSLIEGHTTGLPLINYLPDKAACYSARKWSQRASDKDTWEIFLRRGIRGGTAREIMRIVRSGGGVPEMLKPQHRGIKDRIELWMPKPSRMSVVKICSKCAAKAFQMTTGVFFPSGLTLALRKKA